MKILTIMGTRPEIIRLSATIPVLDNHFDHKVVFTGQNAHPNLSSNIFDDLGLREPDYFLDPGGNTLGSQLGGIFKTIETVLEKEKPQAVVILGDTNSALSAILAARLGIIVYHLEAGNRSFDPRVPEETNRRIVDHVSQFNLVYTEHARRNLLSEGLPEKRIIKTGSPLKEVLSAQAGNISDSNVVSKLGLDAKTFALASFHRQENVENPSRLQSLLGSLSELGEKRGVKVLISTHPRTRNAIERLGLETPSNLVFLEPLVYTDYVKLQISASFVVSDSGTISEEASILGLTALTPRPLIERKEALEPGVVPTVDLNLESMETALSLLDRRTSVLRVPDYEVDNFSEVVCTFIASTIFMAHQV